MSAESRSQRRRPLLGNGSIGGGVFYAVSPEAISGSEDRSTPVRELHKAFSIPYIYDYITKLSRQQAEVIQNHENVNVRNIGQGEAWNRKYKRLKLGGGQAYDRSND
jgi:hypothetical protein